MAYINVDEVYILDNTGLQVDMATDIPFVDAGFTDTQKEQARKNIAAGGTNPNLLDNPWFTINQRNFTSGSIDVQEYTRDRWKNARVSSVVYNDNGTLTYAWNGNATGAFLSQYAMPDIAPMLVGKTVTVSAFIDGALYSKSFVLPSTGTVEYVLGDAVTIVVINQTGTNRGFEFQFRHQSTTGKTIGPVKCELGSVSTLANDAPPDYGTELAKCQYYFRRVSGDVYLCSGMAVSTTAVVFPFPFTMRANPTITMTGTISAVGSGGILAVSSVNSVGKASNAIQVRLTVSGATQYGAYLLTPSNGGYLDFTADL